MKALLLIVKLFRILNFLFTQDSVNIIKIDFTINT